VVCGASEVCFQLTGPCWHLLSIPCNPVDARPTEVFRDSSGDPVPISGNLHRFDGAGYVTYFDFSPDAFGLITPGHGYWLYVFEDTTICYQATCEDAPGHIEFVYSGWHLMGSPRAADVAFGDLQAYHDGVGPVPFSDITNIWIQDPLVYYECGLGYFNAGLHPQDHDHYLRAFGGYWLYTFVDDVILELPPS
jgi:hypothetical protein